MTNPTKRIALGSVVSTETSSETFTPIGLTREITPPPRIRQGVDGVVLGDELETDLPGIEERSEFTFTHLWDPNHANHNIVDTLFASKEVQAWRITYPGATPPIATFPGRVMAITPQSMDPSSAIAREVTIQRTGPIVWTTGGD